jgi:hypothetical protein
MAHEFKYLWAVTRLLSDAEEKTRLISKREGGEDPLMLQDGEAGPTLNPLGLAVGFT